MLFKKYILFQYIIFCGGMKKKSEVTVRKLNPQASRERVEDKPAQHQQWLKQTGEFWVSGAAPAGNIRE